MVASVHGVPKAVLEEAKRPQHLVADATCPLVAEVHREAQWHDRRGREVVLIGHHGHPGMVGTLGELPAAAAMLVETRGHAAAFTPRDPHRLACVTRTTLSVADTADLVDLARRHFADSVGPNQDICYATTNIRDAAKRVAPGADARIVVGSPNSSNAQPLTEMARRSGCPWAALVPRTEDIDWDRSGTLRTLAVTAGASAAAVRVDRVLQAFAARDRREIKTASAAEERLSFPLRRAFWGREAAD